MSVSFFSGFGFSEKSISQAADSIRSTTSYVARSGWSLAHSVGGAVSSVLYPKNGYVGAASTVSGLYARSQTLIHGPAVLAQACDHVTCAYLGSGGKVVSQLFVAPAVVPSLTPIAAGLAAVGATVVTVAALNAAFSYFGA